MTSSRAQRARHVAWSSWSEAAASFVARRCHVLPLVVLVGILMAIAPAPATASGHTGSGVAAAVRAGMPPNEPAILASLREQGMVSPAADRAQQAAALQGYLQRTVGTTPDDKVATGRTFGRVVLRGRTPWGRGMALDPGVTTDNVLVILVEFSADDFASADFPGEVFPGGPVHGRIPPPAATDKATYWPGPGDKGFGTQHFQQMLFGSSFPVYDASGKLRGTCDDTMRDYYLEMSKGTYELEGRIADWVRVPYPEAWYGRDGESATDDHAASPWDPVKDALDAFRQANPGFDWSRYDRKNPFGLAGDDPEIPDGFVDHLILVHAGMDQAAGGGAQGQDAIWAHSSWVDMTAGGGPGGAGGYQVDESASAARPDGVWVGPYTINPEDGGIGVFCHDG
jgi:M6 family metalloprotease-like protein